MNDLSWDEIIGLYRSGFGSIFSVGDTKTTTIGQYDDDYNRTGTAQASVVLISKTKFNGLTFFIQKWIVNDYARTHGSYIGDDARRLALENQENMSEELLLPDCYQYLVSTTQKQTILSDRDKTITGKIVVPSSDTVTNAEYFTGNIQRRISDGAYFLTNRSGTSNPASDWNWYVTSTGAVSSSTSGIGEMAGLAAIFTLR